MTPKHEINMKNALSRHYAAIILSIVSGAVVLAPQIIFMARLGTAYHGVYMMNADAEPHYVARMQEFYDGDGVGNPYYYEGKNSLPDTLYTFSESLLAAPGRIIGISAPTMNLMYKFLLPAAAFLLAYLFMYRLTRRRLWSLAGASLVVMGNMLLSYPDLLHLARLDLSYSQFSLFSRPSNPEFSFLIFIGYLHALLSAIRSKKSVWLLWAAILFGLSFYAYFYSWTFILALNACLFAVLAWKREYRSFSWKLVLATIAGLALGSRAVFEMLSVKMSPLISGLGDEYIVASRHPVVSLAGVAVSLLFIWHLYGKRRKGWGTEDLFFAGLLLATWLDVNQQVFTGISMQTGHYHWYFNTPIFMMTLAYLGSLHFRAIASKFAARLHPIAKAGGADDTERSVDIPGKAFAVIVIAVSIWSCAWVQYSSYKDDRAAAAAEQDYGPVFDWLNADAPKGSVVMASSSLSDLIPAYTSMYVLEDGYGKLYLLSPDRRAYGDAQALVDLHAGKKPPFKLDYIVWDTVSDPDWRIDPIKAVKEAAVIGRFKVYSVAKL